MSYNFYIIDDDKGVRKVLKNIISQHDLGYVIGEGDNGIDAIKEIKEFNPDIVLVDLLLPGIDGIAIVSEIKKMNINTNFIMISQVTSKDLVSKAYNKGIEFFIHKPINVVEVISVINKVKEKITMHNVIQSFEKAFHNMNILKEYTGMTNVQTVSEKDRVKKVLSQLGILGESGSNDIVEMISMILEQTEDIRAQLLKQKLSELYKMLNKRYRDDYKISSNVGAIEQRIRRAIIKALGNIANMGIEDYGNDIFMRYSNTLFDFKEVRKQMDCARGKSNYGGKISVKKFIEGIIVELKSEL
ncbi:response regulator [Crassaminicella thermophila]|uniref:Stage 0 sporulation protein A homolog n=1 Tax=Crassaminicella thermophila TaxID=2599308 RepID=A0A5C0SEP6_CRATE|nr:response regulator [Crassaminicella thermophila]QEK12801.1 response regulator [Crassaminicella thermophila]